MDGMILVAVMAAFAFGGIVKGVVGLGLPLTSVAIMTFFLDLRIVIPILVIPILVTNALQAMRGGRFRQILRRDWTMVAGGGIGAFLGAYILYRIDSLFLLAVLGVVIAVYSVINLFSVRLKLPRAAEPVMSPIVGVFSGILSGTTGSIGIPIVIYFQAIGLSKDVFVQSLGIQFLITGSFLMLALVLEGGYTVELAVISAAGVIPATLGMAAGQFLRDKVSEDKFRIYLFVFMILVGLNMIRKGIL